MHTKPFLYIKNVIVNSCLHNYTEVSFLHKKYDEMSTPWELPNRTKGMKIGHSFLMSLSLQNINNLCFDGMLDTMSHVIDLSFWVGGFGY